MTVLAIARKNNKVCIGADTLIDISGNQVTAEMNKQPDKIFKYKDTWFAYTGSTQSSIMLQHALEEYGDDLSFDGQSNIYKSLLALHKIQKEHFFAMVHNSDSNQAVEDMHLNFLLANPSGIYQIFGDRYVGDIATFWASGSGAKHALGAMHATYDMFDDPVDIVKKGVEAGCKFDSYCGLPMTIYECELNKTCK